MVRIACGGMYRHTIGRAQTGGGQIFFLGERERFTRAGERSGSRPFCA